MTDIYKAPSANLETTGESIKGGSIETALQGQYSVPATDLVKQAWQMKKGFMLPFIFAALIYVVISTAFSTIFELIVPAAVSHNNFLFVTTTIVTTLISTLLLTPMFAGLIMMGIKHAAGIQINVGEIFNYYDKIWPLFLTYLLMSIVLIIGFVCLILPGIYFTIAYMYAMPLVAEKNLSPWEAMETSRKAITKKWWSVFGFSLLLWLIIMLGFIAFFVGVFIAAPITALAFGILYVKMFGVGVDENTML